MRKNSARTHQCHAHGCPRMIASRFLMCSDHWRRVPADLQKTIYDTCGDRNPKVYHQAIREAQKAVREQGQREAAENPLVTETLQVFGGTLASDESEVANG